MYGHYTLLRVDIIFRYNLLYELRDIKEQHENQPKSHCLEILRMKPKTASFISALCRVTLFLSCDSGN